jgi:hypothetical protein
MSKEHEWLEEVAEGLNNGLMAKYIGDQPEVPNRFGLVTFGAKGLRRRAGHIISVGNSGSYLGNPDELKEALSHLKLTGRLEDGYQGIVTALNGYTFRPNVAKQFILITDENRDILDPTLTYGQILADLTNASVVLNAVVNQAFDQDGRQAFGLDWSKMAYLTANNSKGFVSAHDGRAVPEAGDGTTFDDYVTLALETEGAAWNLQLLRQGGKIAKSFTKAFIDVKVKEISRQLRTCRRCTCERDGPDTCEEFQVESQADCPIPISTPTPSSGSVQRPKCRISGNQLNDGSTIRQYVIKTNGDFNSTSSYPSADVVFVVDESGSMVEEHEWLEETIYYLDDALRQEGIGEKVPNRYGLVGFATTPHVNGAVHPLGVGYTQMGTPREFATRIRSLATSGQVEDGYRAIETALNGFQFRTGNVARQLILVTDEDRDNTITILSSDIKQLLDEKDFRINVIVNHGFLDSAGERILGMNAEYNGYKADISSSNEYLLVPGASLFKDTGHGTTLRDYVMLAMDTKGAAWDLNQLRQGGQLAKSFTNSFIDAKVGEISEQLKVCQECSCSQSLLTCTDDPDASNADQCYRQGACKVGNEYYDTDEQYCSYSIFQDFTGLAPQAAADVLIVVDESRSMEGEHRWLKDVVKQLDIALKARSVGLVTPNQFGLVGFANNDSDRTDMLGTILMIDKKKKRMMGSASEFHKLIKQLHLSGKYEDGYTAIMRALNAKSFRSNTAKLMMLVTDEDRDVLVRNINFTSVYNALKNEGVILNTVVSQGFESGGAVALGIDGFGNAYFMNKTVIGGERQIGYTVRKHGQPIPESGHGSTFNDYTRLAWDTEGGAWDLNRLRNGGAVAKAFTKAFVAVKVKEALSQLETCRICRCQHGTLQCRAFEANRTACTQACTVPVPVRFAEDPPDNLIGQEGIGTDIKLPVSVEVLPTSLKVCLGDTPLISCIGRTFNGTVKVKWSYKGNPVSSLRQNNDRQNLARQLKVRVKSAEDTGDYTCTVTAHSQQAISQATVTLAETCLNNCGQFLGQGYAIVYRGRSASPHINITMRFCPTSVISGVLHCLEGTETSNCAQCLVLADGFLELRWHCCVTEQSLLLEQLPVAADKCHTTTFTTTNTEATVELNGQKQTVNLQSTCWDDFKPSRVVSLGGCSIYLLTSTVTEQWRQILSRHKAA